MPTFYELKYLNLSSAGLNKGFRRPSIICAGGEKKIDGLMVRNPKVYKPLFFFFISRCNPASANITMMVRKTVLLIFVCTLLFIRLPYPCTAEEKDIDIPVIKAKSHYELGYKQGEMFKPYYRGLFFLSGAIFGKLVNESMVRKHLDILKSRYPEFLERLKGLGDSLGLNLSKTLKISLALSSISAGCTITAVNGNVTKNGERYLSWNLDLPYIYKLLFSRYLRPPPMVICDIEGKYRYVEVSSLPSIFGFGLLNEKGLSCVYAMVIPNDIGDGLTPLELNHLAMEGCKDINGVRDIYENNERESGHVSIHTAFGLTANLNALWSDSSGRQMLVEYNHSKVVFVYGDILASTNHYQYLYNESFTSEFMIGSKMRLERAYQLLENYTGNIDDDFFTKILTRDHKNSLPIGDGTDICRHGLTYGTVCCVIIKPDSYEVLYSPGHPCRFGFRLIDLSEVAEKP